MKGKKSVVAVIGAFLLTIIALLSFAGCKQEDPKCHQGGKQLRHGMGI